MASNEHGATGNISTCQGTPNSIDHAGDTVLPEAVTTERLIDNPVEHYSRDPMERATTLNDFMRFLREMTSVANLDGLISLAQAFLWGDLGMVSSFHKHGVPVVVHGSKSNNRDLRWHAPLPVIAHLKPPTFTSASAKHKGMPSTAVESAPLLTPPPAAAHNADDIIEELYQALRMQVRESKAKNSMQDTILPDQAKRPHQPNASSTKPRKKPQTSHHCVMATHGHR
ncbi:hypothetical protein H257_12400 [Aphanomyces astaci]|uniref:Uncharacterized protein n=1 Tax=Aphanomyces astaci TaxID=112090 RepID=W4FYW2_APHAT|nr:hypothetical protein H257_12400 [Aphanomyces astaci]ETV72652.1 hypothetical protein H257_12400 [Aphanomyces astaci]|eukprot:XP_009837880.1 hypothetical protein H257_12400 [Aphanomyces astaci]